MIKRVAFMLVVLSVVLGGVILSAEGASACPYHQTHSS